MELNVNENVIERCFEFNENEIDSIINSLHSFETEFHLLNQFEEKINTELADLEDNECDISDFDSMQIVSDLEDCYEDTKLNLMLYGKFNLGKSYIKYGEDSFRFYLSDKEIECVGKALDTFLKRMKEEGNEEYSKFCLDLARKIKGLH